MSLMNIPSIKSFCSPNKIALLRADFNVPTKDGSIQDSTRIVRVLPTIKYLESIGSKIVILSHFGRPKGLDNDLSLKMMTDVLSKFLKKEIKFIDDCIGEKAKETIGHMSPKDVILLENLRYYPGEEQNDLDFAKQLASMGDLYVNDAFSCSHRTHASISCITEFLPAYAGLSLLDELKQLKELLSFRSQPIAAIVGGTKISTKLKLLGKLAEKVNFLIVGGAIANNFFLINKVNIGKSFVQKNINHLLPNIIEISKKNNCKIILPEDVLVEEDTNHTLRKIEFIKDNDVILDIGPKTLKKIFNTIENCKTILWNGPIGVFERPDFSQGTIALMHVISNLTKEKKLLSIIGGGDSLSAMRIAGLTDKDFTYVSTGGGSFLSWLSGDPLPGIIALQKTREFTQ